MPINYLRLKQWTEKGDNLTLNSYKFRYSCHPFVCMYYRTGKSILTGMYVFAKKYDLRRMFFKQKVYISMIGLNSSLFFERS